MSDLDAVKAEALGEQATIVFRDAKFQVAAPDTWLVQFAHYADRDKITLALEAALGAEQYERFLALKPSPSMTEVGQLIDQIVSAFNVNAGE